MGVVETTRRQKILVVVTTRLEANPELSQVDEIVGRVEREYVLDFVAQLVVFEAT
jgi:hypothetical protein